MKFYFLLALVTVFCAPAGAETTDNYQLLFIGNSHSASNNLPGMVRKLIKAGVPDATVRSELAPGYRFLADRLDDGVTDSLLKRRDWTHVILQAQKYSSSGQFTYPTLGAEEWIRRVKEQDARPILFPEWPRRGNTEEGQRVHNLHLGIASREQACVAPIGLAWETSVALNPGLRLHAPDGNHSNPAGALLTAFVLYEVITGQAAESLPYVSSINVSQQVQKSLRDIASTVVQRNSAACPVLLSTATIQSAEFQGIPALGRLGVLSLIVSLSVAGIIFRHAGR